MPRRKLERRKSEYIQVAIEPDEKAAFDAWCAANSTTMSDVIRKEIAGYIAKGKKLMEAAEG
ncbi:hypothetical protein [Thermoleptolyngbya sp. C42_A2020_037]|uniref:hypothetical protein n=1 Tax=Thermoleptolyngbya sp. C42_A2020_037 TaxID=2747799 RepID=UPI0019F0CFEC|nr:hypothetical protein [Thermoleptolyngbya sp. C42_A2020_037]MBF2085404.1 hypothetical protein [Thermoleptolyngbya sp. C42_A2020_037]